MQGVLRYNPERTHFEAQVDEERFEPEAWPETNMVLLTDGKSPYLAVLDGYEGLKSHTIYQLVALPTIVDGDTEFDDIDDDDVDDIDDDDDLVDDDEDDED